MKKRLRIKGLGWKILFFIGFGVAIALFWVLELPCVWKKIFSVPCLGCGLTRAFKCLLAGDIGGAFSWNFMFWSTPILVWAIVFDGKITGRKRVDFYIYLLLGIGFCARWFMWFI